jgi:hypothetical protein
MFSTHLVAHNMADRRETGIEVHGEGEGRRDSGQSKCESKRERASERDKQGERAKERDSAQESKRVK